MPSPFPGMDPYLEDPTLWPDVHLRLINAISEFLLPQIRPTYFCRAEERIYVVDEFDSARKVIIPDVSISELDRGTLQQTTASPASMLAEPIPVVTLMDDEIHEPYLQIINTASRQVVTVIEVLSPSNKISGSSGMASYKEKRRDVLRSNANWVEIDLLRGGVRIPLNGRFTESDYRMHWSRVNERPRDWVLPVALEQRLPGIPIPVRPEDPEATLDLQAVLNLVYERAGYELVLDYDRDPVPPLTPAQREWAKPILTKT